MGLSWLLLSIGVGAKPTEFQLDTDSPDALCPELSIARDAVKKRLGQLEVEGGGTWHGRYSTVHDPGGRRGDYVRLVIIDPSGKEQVTRELPMQGESCATMAQVMALVIDSYFRDVVMAPHREPAPEKPAAELTEPAPSNSAPPSPAPDKPKETTSESAVREPTSEPSGELGLVVGGGYESEPSSAAAVFGLFVAITPRWRMDLRSAFPTSRVSEGHEDSTAYLYPIPLRLSLSYVTPSYHGLSWFMGPELLLSLEHASIAGVPNGHSGWRATFGVGARTGIALRLGPSLALATNVSTDVVAVQSRQFLVVDNPVLDGSRARLAGTLELWGAIFP